MKTNTRLLRLMEDVTWRGIPNWTTANVTLKRAEILAFKAWFKENIVHVPEPWRVYLEAYVLDDAERTFTTTEFSYINLARAVLRGVYAKEKEYERQRTDN